MFTQDYNNGPSLNGFKEFVQRKPADEHYEWMNSSICACGQYAQSIGFKNWMYEVNDTGVSIWSTLNMLAKGDGFSGDKSDWTFGKLAERLKEVA